MSEKKEDGKNQDQRRKEREKKELGLNIEEKGNVAVTVASNLCIACILKPGCNENDTVK